jgi:hypothetical protein
MEGSWTFAGCVISDSKSSTPSHAQLYTKRGGICRFRFCEAHDFRRTSLTCPQIKRRGNRRAVPSLLKDIETSRKDYERRRESLCCLAKAMSSELTIASNALVARA